MSTSIANIVRDVVLFLIMLPILYLSLSVAVQFHRAMEHYQSIRQLQRTFHEICPQHHYETFSSCLFKLSLQPHTAGLVTRTSFSAALVNYADRKAKRNVKREYKTSTASTPTNSVREHTQDTLILLPPFLQWQVVIVRANRRSYYLETSARYTHGNTAVQPSHLLLLPSSLQTHVY